MKGYTMSYKIPKVVHSFKSFQGEGLRSCRPCVFIRFFGCTLPGCPGFGQKDPSDKSTWETQTYDINVSPKYGCDSPSSWYKPFEKFCKSYNSAEQMYNSEIGPYDYVQRKEVIITGGEPMIWQDFLVDFIKYCYSNGTKNFTIETNGMLSVTDDLLSLIESVPANFLFSVSPKLNCVAGVDESKSINIDCLKRYLELMATHHNIECQFKFVVNQDDRSINKVYEIRDAILEGRNGDYQFFKDLLTEHILLMPVGAIEHSEQLKQKVAQLCIDNGFVYCPRIHVDVWGAKTGV